MRSLFAAVLFLLLLPASAAALTPKEALDRYFTAPELEAAWFTPEMLAAVPLPSLTALRDRLAAEHGPYQGAEPLGDGWRVRLARATLRASIALDDQGRIAGLWLGPPQPRDETLEAVAAELAALPGEVSLLVLRDGAVLAERQPDRALSVGSAFKLAVLAALAEEVAAGRASWEEVLRLQERHRSLASGLLQDWPAGAPLTLHSLAALMISLSDNTATDALIDRLGRERVEAALPVEARPLLTTREFFLLAGRSQAERRQRFLVGDAAARRALLAELAGEEPSLAEVQAGDAGAALGWHLSARTLCALMERTFALDLLGINPGLADPATWARVAYKGGSQPGVISMVSGLVDDQGRQLCVALVWNEPALDQERFSQLYTRLLAVLERG